MSDNEMLRQEYAALAARERHANYGETRYWCDQYKAFAKRIIDRPALTDEQVREIAEKWAFRCTYAQPQTRVSTGQAIEAAIREAIGRGERG